MQIEHLIS